jgi:hypothetical protein
MNSSNEQEPFSVAEFAAGSIAVTAVALIAFLGASVSQLPDFSPANLSQASPPPAAPRSSSAPSPANLSQATPSPATQPSASALSPANLSQASPPPAIPPSASAKVSEWRRDAPAAMARARPSPLPEGMIVRELESSAPASAASRPPTSSPDGTKASPALDFFNESDPGATVEMRPPDIDGAPLPLIGPLDLFRMKDAVRVQPPGPIREAAIPPPGAERSLPPLIGPLDLFRMKDAVGVQPPGPTTEAAIPPPGVERNPSNRSDALWVQTKLHDLGYYAGNSTGVWGQASRNALRDFKMMNGLQEDDRWDQETEQRLSSGQSVHASGTFIGGWADNIGECQHFRGSGAPLVIRSRGAATDRSKCDFRSVKREAATTWRIQAACSSEGQSWNANISVKLNGSNLSWSSEQGAKTYVRCLKP